MTQEQAIVLAFKIAEIASLVTIAAFVGYYTVLARWWRSPIGLTIVAKDIALILVLLPSVLSMFFQFNRLTSYVAAWFDVGSFTMVPVIMVWRIVVWRRLDRLGRLPRNGHDGLIQRPGRDPQRHLLSLWADEPPVKPSDASGRGGPLPFNFRSKEGCDGCRCRA